MFLPLGDEPNPRGVPWVTYGLIATNVAVYLLISLPLSGVRPDLGDPALAGCLRVLAEQLGGRLSETELLLQMSAYDLVVFTHGFRPADPAPAALLTSMFLHAGFMHLAGNMLFLWIYGDNVEHRLGPGRFLLAYLATGIAATLFHTAFDSGSELPLVGASARFRACSASTSSGFPAIGSGCGSSCSRSSCRSCIGRRAWFSVSICSSTTSCRS